MVLADVSSGDTIAATDINNIHDAEQLMSELLFFRQAGTVFTTPGVVYSSIAPTARTKIDFSTVEVVYCRVIGRAAGDEAGAGKGLQIWDNTGGQQICEVEWDGAGDTNIRGAWTDVTSLALAVDSEIRVRVKASSGTEDIELYKVVLQMRYRFDH